MVSTTGLNMGSHSHGMDLGPFRQNKSLAPITEIDRLVYKVSRVDENAKVLKKTDSPPKNTQLRATPPPGPAQGPVGRLHSDARVLAHPVPSRASPHCHDTAPAHLCLLGKPPASESHAQVSPSNCRLWPPPFHHPHPIRLERKGGRERGNYPTTKSHLPRRSSLVKERI